MAIDKDTIKVVIETIVHAASENVSTKKLQKTLCGEYEDGSTRNVIDAVNGEIFSPKQRKNKLYKKRKSGKKKVRL